MQSALEAFGRGESLDFAVHHSGVALEHLLKAYLCSLHPALAIDAHHLQSLLHALNLADRSTIHESRAKTIGLAEAFTRTRDLLPGKITVTKDEFEPVLAARNGIAHAGVHDPNQERLVVTTCIRIATPVLDELDQTPTGYWGHYCKLVEQLVNQHATDLQLRVEAKIGQARRAFHQRFDREPATHRASVIAALSATNPINSDYDEHDDQINCPACEGRGWLHGTTNVDWNYVDEGKTRPVVMFYADRFACSVCSLHLEGDELEEAGLEPRSYLFDEDPHDHVWPDEDLAYESYRDDRLTER
jgi:hypothetical protein